MKTVFGLVGPTASGKSDIGKILSYEFKLRIINADSCQIYKGLDILCGMPELDDNHRLYAFLNLQDKFNVFEWYEKAVEEIEKCFQDGFIPLILGGTGLYFKILQEGICAIPKVPELNYEISEVINFLKKEDAQVLNFFKDARRLNKCLSVKRSTGNSILEYQKKNIKLKDYEINLSALIPEKKHLHSNIQLRIKKQFEMGLKSEVDNCPAFSCVMIGYDEIKKRAPNADEIMFIKTKQYAKRQITYIKNVLKKAQIFDDSSVLLNFLRMKFNNKV